jgi:hypothetical protein
MDKKKTPGGSGVEVVALNRVHHSSAAGLFTHHTPSDVLGNEEPVETGELREADELH